MNIAFDADLRRKIHICNISIVYDCIMNLKNSSHLYFVAGLLWHC